MAGSTKSAYVRGRSTSEYLGRCSSFITTTIHIKKITNIRHKSRSLNLPGSLLSANDQFDKGPVTLRTVTQTSSKELEEGSGIRNKTKLNIKRSNTLNPPRRYYGQILFLLSYIRIQFPIINRTWLLPAWGNRRIEFHTLEKVPSRPFEIHGLKLFVVYWKSNKGNVYLSLMLIPWQETSNFWRTWRKLEKVPAQGKQLQIFIPLTDPKPSPDNDSIS